MTSHRKLLEEPTPNWLNEQARSLLEFARASRHEFGFAALDADGDPEPGHLELYITCRMTYAYALGAQLGIEGSSELVEHGLRALAERFSDTASGGWVDAMHEDGGVY